MRLHCNKGNRLNMRITARVDQLVNLTERAINGDGGSHGFIGTFKKKNHMLSERH